MGGDGGGAAASQGADKGPLRRGFDGGAEADEGVQAAVVFSGPPLEAQDPLAGGGDDLVRGKVPADAVSQPYAAEAGGSQDQGPVLPLVQLAEPGLKIAAHALKGRLREEVLRLQDPPPGGCPYGL